MTQQRSSMLFSLSHWHRVMYKTGNSFLFKLNNFRGLSENMSENQVLKLTAETKASIVCPSSGLVLEGEWSDEI